MCIGGELKGVVGGPNCRTRSLLRHIPIPGATDAPRPIRGWFGEEYGINDATSEELEKIREDDILAWRMVFVFMVATYMRRAMGISEKVAFALEQPASPCSYMPEVGHGGKHGNGKKSQKSLG